MAKGIKIAQKITTSSEVVNRYLNEIGKIKLLTPKQELELCIRIKKGDLLAQKNLIEANSRFVVSVAKQYLGKGVPLPDLISEGNIGLIKAAKHFDHTRGFKFISFAVWLIRNYIILSISKNSRTVRIPVNVYDDVNLLKKAYDKLEQTVDGHRPTPRDVSKATGLNEDKVLEIFSKTNLIGGAVELDKPIGDNVAETKVTLLLSEDSAESLVMRDELKSVIKRLMFKLTERESFIVRHYYGLDGEEPKTLEQIGGMLDITRERTRQILKASIKKLRCANSRELRAYLN